MKLQRGSVLAYGVVGRRVEECDWGLELAAAWEVGSETTSSVAASGSTPPTINVRVTAPSARESTTFGRQI